VRRVGHLRDREPHPAQVAGVVDPRLDGVARDAGEVDRALQVRSRGRVGFRRDESLQVDGRLVVGRRHAADRLVADDSGICGALQERQHPRRVGVPTPP
jgi:hypothetical protein